MIVFIIILIIVAIPFIAALFIKKDYAIERTITINRPKQTVFDFVKYIKNQDFYNKWTMMDPNSKRDYKGTDGTVGYIYAWSGDKDAGQGEKEIKDIIEGKSIEMEIRFAKPMKVSAAIVMETESLSDNQTKVSWSNGGVLKYPLNIMIPMMEKMIPKEMDTSLSTLKNILEK